MLRLKGVEFRNVFAASGTLNFFGQGWRFHKLYRHIPGFSFNNATFIAKTGTYDRNEGCMKLNNDLQPVYFLPDCIKVYFLKGVVLNAVKLSNPGMRHLLWLNKWQELRENFFLSIMAIRATADLRLDETRKTINLLGKQNFSAKYGLEINFCPNIEHSARKGVQETIAILKIASGLGIPLVVKVDILTGIDYIKEVADSGLVDAFSCTNTLKWGVLADRIKWKEIFGTDVSPLAKYGGGAMSGNYLLPLLVEWIYETKKHIDIPIIAGGGILRKYDAKQLKEAGADAVAIGTVAIIRPHRVQGIIDYANSIFI